MDSNLTLCDLQISGEGGEVCALECAESVCFDVVKGSVRDLHFTISGGKTECDS